MDPLPGTNLGRTARFLASLLPALVLLGVFFGVVAWVGLRIGGITGGALGLAAGISLVFAVLLAYWNAVDWLNLRLVRRAAAGPLEDGAAVAFEGVVRVDGAPLVAPFSGTRCAAYTYVVSCARHSAPRGRSRRVVLLQGFHLVRTRIEGGGRSLRLGSFPSLESDLREVVDGSKGGRAAAALGERLAEAPSAGERERESRLLAFRHGEVEEVHEDYRMGAIGENVGGLTLEEEVLPANEPVCVVGTYDEARQRLVARRRRLGPDLIVYRGTAQQVLARVGGDLSGYARAAAVLGLVGAAILAFACVVP